MAMVVNAITSVPGANVLFAPGIRLFGLDFFFVMVGGLAVAVGVGGFAVAADAEVFEELGGDLAGVFALGVAAATEEVTAAAAADDHGLAALVAVDVGGGAVDGLGLGGGGIFAEDLGGHLGGLRAFFLQQRHEGFDLLELVADELFHHLGRAAFGEAGAAEERAALGVAQDHRAAALLTRHGGLDLDLGRLGFAFLVEVDDGAAARLALVVFD